MRRISLLFLLVVGVVGVVLIGTSPVSRQFLGAVTGRSPETVNDLTEEDRRVVAARAYAALDARFMDDVELPPVTFTPAYHKLYVTVLRDGVTRCCMSGRTGKSEERRLEKDVDDAVERCAKDDRFDGRLREDEREDAQMMLTFLTDRREASRDPKELAKEMEPGVHALELRSGGKSTFFKESVPVTDNLTVKQTMQQLCKKAKLDSKCYESEDVKFYLLDAHTYVADREGAITALERFNVPLSVGDITPALIKERVALAEQWFLRMVKDDGFLEYEYFPGDDEYSKENNTVRQVASIWAMLTIDRFLGSGALDPVIGAMLDRYFTSASVCEEDACRVEIDGTSKLAYNAFILLSLLERPDTPDTIQWRARIANGILAEQRDDGSFHTIHGSDSTSNVDYYPGEAMLALMRLYNKTGEKSYLKAVEKAFPYYRDYWRGNRNTAFVPWQTQVYVLLYEANSAPAVANFVFEMNDWIIDTHQIVESPYEDEIGAFKRGNPNNTTAVYSEGINDAYRLAQLLRDTEHADKYRESIRRAARFILLSQYTPGNALSLPNRDRAIGGFRESLIVNAQRIDSTQHAINALIKAYQNGIF